MQNVLGEICWHFFPFVAQEKSRVNSGEERGEKYMKTKPTLTRLPVMRTWPVVGNLSALALSLSLRHSGNTKQMVFRYVAERYDDENANSFRLLNVSLVFFLLNDHLKISRVISPVTDTRLFVKLKKKTYRILRAATTRSPKVELISQSLYQLLLIAHSFFYHHTKYRKEKSSCLCLIKSSHEKRCAVDNVFKLTRRQQQNERLL